MAISVDYATLQRCLLFICCLCQFILTGCSSFPKEDMKKDHLLLQLSENDADKENFKDVRGHAPMT